MREITTEDSTRTYEAPVVRDLGTVSEVTHGTTVNPTTDVASFSL
jgi:hypothetical protein